MDLPVVTYKREEYVETASGNKVFKSTAGHICGTQNIVLTGKAIVQNEVVLRGDLASIRIGMYTIIKTGTVIRPSPRKYSKGVALFPVHIGDHVMIEENCIVSAAQICSFVHIGCGSIVGNGAIIKEGCRITPGSVVAPEDVFAPYSTIAGNPAKWIGQEPETTELLMTELTKQYYDNFVPADSSRVLQ